MTSPLFKKYLFLDRDGTLIQEPSDFQVDTLEKFRLVPDVIPSLLALKSEGYHFVMVSNQDRLGSIHYPLEAFQRIQKIIIDIFETQGILFESVLICPHSSSDGCPCRKPQTGLLRDYLRASNWDRKNSYVIGDRQTDLILASNLGVPGIQIEETRGWIGIASQIISQNRGARLGSVRRRTRETEVSVQVNLDPPPMGAASRLTPEVHTGIGFFDHLLEQLSFHGAFDLRVSSIGDLHVDDHHLIEDVGLALGQALLEALGNKNGMGRYGFYLPMDDATAQVTLDLSGRSYFVFDGKWGRDQVGGMATEMIPHFFRSFSDSLKANLHIRLQGENTHHLAESAFKAVGRSLRSAIRLDSVPKGIPSTKGIL